MDDRSEGLRALRGIDRIELVEEACSYACLIQDCAGVLHRSKKVTSRSLGRGNGS